MINPNEYGSFLFDEKELENINNVIKARRIFRYSKTPFDYVSQFEAEVCNTIHSKYCLGVVNGTAGLIISLCAAGIKSGDTVLVSSYTFQATALAVIAVGANPVPLEIDLDTGIDILDLERNYTLECKAIIVTQLQGRCFNLTKLKLFAKEKNIVLIEDACQAFGAHYKGLYSGCQGDIGVFSFQQFKQITAGEGGAIVTDTERYYQYARNYSDMGAVRQGFPDWNAPDTIMGQNYRMNQLCGAILCAQLKKLNYMISRQRSSRERIYNLINSHCESIIHSKYHNGDTGMNILLTVNPTFFETVVQLAKHHNIEIRKMWRGLYFENTLFQNAHLTDFDLRLTICSKSHSICDEMAVISIPPILNDKHEKIIAKLIDELNDNHYLGSTLRIG